MFPRPPQPSKWRNFIAQLSSMPRRSLFKLAAALICSILFLKVLYESTMVESTLKTELLASGIQLRVREASVRTNINGTAFVFLALGVQANQMNCPGAIESLVRFGGWGGHVFMLTDKEGCFDRDRILRDSEIDEDKLHVIKVHDHFGGGGVDMEHGFRKNRQLSMAVKATLFDYLPQWVHTIAYADCDILFGIQGCPAQFITGGPSWDEAKMKFSRLFYEPDGEFIGGIHCGTFVAHREHSKVVMQLWRDMLLTLKYEGDNDAYQGLFLALQAEIDRRRKINGTAIHHINLEKNLAHINSWFSQPANDDDFFKKYLLPGGKNLFWPSEIFVGEKQASWTPESMEQHRVEKFVHPPSMLQSTHAQCMVHIAKARCSRFGRDVMQLLVDKYNLRSYLKEPTHSRPIHRHTPTQLLSNAPMPAPSAVVDVAADAAPGQIVYADDNSDQEDDRYFYCSNPMIQPLLYGWFPFDWLPMCPKLESIL